MNWLPEFILWASAGIIAYTCLGFPLLAAIRCRWFSRPLKRCECKPSVSIIVPAHNEETHLKGKLENIRSLNYPPGKIEVIVASDGSTDGTEYVASDCADSNVRLLALPRRGKNATINSAVSGASNQILVFTDADSQWDPEALSRLMMPFADSSVGGVAGDVIYKDYDRSCEGERLYWNFDRDLRKLLSLCGSVTSATGQIYAIRRELFEPVPPSVIDDFFVSTSVIAKGYRLAFEPGAIATHPAVDSDREFKRKVRNLAIGFRGVWQQRRLLNPLRFGFYSLQLATQKILKRLTFVPSTAILFFIITTGPETPLIITLRASCCLALLLAAAGHVLRNSRYGKIKFLAVPWYFLMTNIACAIALFMALAARQADKWQPQRSSPGIN